MSSGWELFTANLKSEENRQQLLDGLLIFRAPRYRIHGTQYKTVQSWLVFKHVSTVQCSGSSFIQIQYKTKQFLYPKFSSVQYSTASRIRYIVSTVQNSIDICFVLHWYYKIQSSKSFIGVTSISNSQNCIGQSLLLELVVLRANNNVAFGGTRAFWTTIVLIIKLKNLSVCLSSTVQNSKSGQMNFQYSTEQ